MRRILYLIKKELLAVRSTLPFHLIVVLMPIVFLCFWLLALEQDITFPVHLVGAEIDPALAEHVAQYATPDGTTYFGVREQGADQMNTITIVERIGLTDATIGGAVELELRSIDRNMTKNYRNRLTGAVTSYVEQEFLGSSSVRIEERLVHEHDVPWAHFFVTSITVLGVLMGGMLFGSLSMASEWSSGTITFLHTSPRNPLWVLVGKLAALLIKGAVAISLLLGVSAAVLPDLSMPFLSILGVAVLGYLIIGLAGMAVGTVAKDPITCFLVALLGSIALWLLGNGFGNITFLGSAIATVTEASPATHLLAMVQHFASGSLINWGQTWLVLGCWAVAMHVVVWVLYRQRIHLPRERHA